jgi:D-threo-aldose 1-dehydrogenase
MTDMGTLEGMTARELGETTLWVTAVCVGCAPLSGNFGYDVGLERALATLRRAFGGPFNFLDTSNNYGGGESERRIGMVLAELGGLPEGFVLASKVDRDPCTGAFDGERARRSFGETLSRLGLDRLQLLYLHDPEVITFEEAMRPGGAVEALVALREEGSVSYIGVAGGAIGLMTRFVDTGAFDVVLTHNRYTLLDHSAESLIAKAVERGVGVVNAAVFGGGVLAKGVEQLPKYAYHELTPEARQRVEEIEALCSKHGVPLKAAALQFSLRDPRVASTAVGISLPERVDETAELALLPIPEVLWERLEELTLPADKWLY